MIRIFNPVFPAASYIAYLLGICAGAYEIDHGNPDLAVLAVIGIVIAQAAIGIAAWIHTRFGRRWNRSEGNS